MRHPALLLLLAGCASETVGGDPVDARVVPDAALPDRSLPAPDEGLDAVAPDATSASPDAALPRDATTHDAIPDVHAAADAAGPVPDAAPPDEGARPALPTRQPAGLPRVHDLSGADPAHVDGLVRRALEGLGLDPVTGPDPRDRVFVGRWYLAWIDETGFYGKLNGLWALNGDVANLDFVLLDADRPVSALVVGEHGDGAWPGGYMGAEHIEYPNGTPEADDEPGCANEGSFCAQYSLGEAPHYRDPDIPTWRACNEGSPAFDRHFEPIELTPIEGGVRLMYEGPLTKQGDFGGSSSGRHCHEDWLFPDRVRRRVYLRVGYELLADGHDVDRLLQVRNPEGNPRFAGPFSFIGGFVMTAWPDAHPLKRIQRHARTTLRPVEIRWGEGNVGIAADRWSALPAGIPNHDVILAWAGQGVSLSPFPGYTAGRAFTLSNEGPEDNDDAGFCLCVVHGAIELGGGLIHGAVEGGASSFVARRRLRIHHEEPPPEPRLWTYEAERDLQHGIGHAEEDGWSASTADDEAGHLAFGPYARDWGAGPRSAAFRLLVDVADARDERVVTLDVYDADTDEILATRDIPRSAFGAAYEWRDFTLDFDLAGRDGHAMETRVYWHDISYVRLDRIVVSDR